MARRSRFSTLSLAIGLALVAIACGFTTPPQSPTVDLTPSPFPSATMEIPASGGTLRAGGATVMIPGDALSASAAGSISASEPASAAPSATWPMHAVGPTWTIDLAGARLAKPVTLELPFGAASLPAGIDPAELLLAYRDDATSRWVPVPATVDAAAGTVKAGVSHLSIWGLFAPDWDYWLALLKTAASGNVTAFLHGLATFASGCQTQAGIYTIDNSAANKMIEGCLTETSPTAVTLEIRNLRAFALEVTDPRGYIPKQSVLLMPGDAVPFTVSASDAQPVIAQADMNILGLTASIVDIVLGLLPNIDAARVSPEWRAAFTEIVTQVAQLHSLSDAIAQAEAGHIPQAAEAAVTAISEIDFLTTLATASHAAGLKYGIPALANVGVAGLQKVMLVVGLGDLVVTAWSFFGDWFFNVHTEVHLTWKLSPPAAPTGPVAQPLGTFACATDATNVCERFRISWHWPGPGDAQINIYWSPRSIEDCFGSSACVPPPPEQACDVSQETPVGSAPATAGTSSVEIPSTPLPSCFRVEAVSSAGRSPRVWAVVIP